MNHVSPADHIHILEGSSWLYVVFALRESSNTYRLKRLIHMRNDSASGSCMFRGPGRWSGKVQNVTFLSKDLAFFGWVLVNISITVCGHDLIARKQQEVLVVFLSDHALHKRTLFPVRLATHHIVSKRVPSVARHVPAEEERR